MYFIFFVFSVSLCLPGLVTMMVTMSFAGYFLVRFLLLSAFPNVFPVLSGLVPSIL